MTLTPETSKEREVLDRMELLLIERGFKRCDNDVAFYRRGDVEVVLRRTSSMHDPIKATAVSHSPSAWNSTGLAIVLDGVEGR